MCRVKPALAGLSQGITTKNRLNDLEVPAHIKKKEKEKEHK
jgi:hypothetical protein